MEFSADELRFKIFKLHHEGISIPEYETIIKKLREFSQELGDTKRDIDYWCGRLAELKVCQGAIENMEA